MLKSLYPFVLLALISGGSIACKILPSERDSETLVQAQNAATAPSSGSDTVILYFGGFNSCSFRAGQEFPENIDPISPPQDELAVSMMKWVPYFNRAYAAKGFAKAHRTLIACYPPWTTLPLEVASALRALSGNEPRSTGPGQGSAADSDIYFRHNFQGDQIPTQKYKLGSLMSSLDRLLSENQFKKAVIIGHSFGGYTAMLAAKALISAGSQIQVTSLTTLDPISISTCNVQGITSAIVKRQGSPGCNQAPGTNVSDPLISLADIRSIAAKTRWINVWQAGDIYIHSSAINAPGIDNREIVANANMKDGVLNHVLYAYPGNSTNPAWPKLTDEIVNRAVESLR